MLLNRNQLLKRSQLKMSASIDLLIAARVRRRVSFKKSPESGLPANTSL